MKSKRERPGPQTKELAKVWRQRLTELLMVRACVSDDDLVYLIDKTNKLNDEKLKDIIGNLIGWGSDEREEIQSICAIMLRVVEKSTAAKVRECWLIQQIGATGSSTSTWTDSKSFLASI